MKYHGGSICYWSLNPWVDGRPCKGASLQLHILPCSTDPKQVSCCVSTSQRKIVVTMPMNDDLMQEHGLVYLCKRVIEEYSHINTMEQAWAHLESQPRFVARRKALMRLKAEDPTLERKVNENAHCRWNET
jgi:pyrimidine deaminase RibD-like protein